MTAPINPVIWFEIPAADLERAKAFYEQALGIELSLHEVGKRRTARFPTSDAVGGIGGSLVQAHSYVPSFAGTLVYFAVDDIEVALARIKACGGKVISPMIGTESGHVAHFEDTERNRIGLRSLRQPP